MIHIKIKRKKEKEFQVQSSFKCDWPESVHKKPEHRTYHMKDQTLLCSRDGLERVLPALGGATSRMAPIVGGERMAPWWILLSLPYALGDFTKSHTVCDHTQIHQIICFHTSFFAMNKAHQNVCV